MSRRELIHDNFTDQLLLFIEGPSEEPGQSEADMLHVGMATQRCHTWRNASLLRNNIDSP
ncbi:hypothetical protein IC336_003361 [Salmonella enterica]|nr:hypothetical protein [Salmonella enterica]